jgi:hypothetical protein
MIKGGIRGWPCHTHELYTGVLGLEGKERRYNLMRAINFIILSLAVGLLLHLHKKFVLLSDQVISSPSSLAKLS